MNRLMILFLLLIVSASFAIGVKYVGSAKRVLINKEHTRNAIALEMHVYKDTKALRRAIKKDFPDQNVKDIIGFSVWNNVDNKCDVYVTEARRESDFETWGHEIAHCMYGRWHKE